MSLLLKATMDNNETFAKKTSFSSGIGIPTGFTILDIMSSNVVENVDGVKLLNGGLFNNVYNGVGESSTGKTTLWLQKCAECVNYWNRRYGAPVSELIFYNVEQHTSIDRIAKVTGWGPAELMENLRFVTSDMSIKEIFADIAVLAKQKQANRKELEVSTGIYDSIGNEMKVLPTTYVMIDSIASLRPDGRRFEEDDSLYDKHGDLIDDGGIAGSNNIDAMRMAKDNTTFIHEIKRLCESVSISVVMINHIQEAKPVSMFDRPQKLLPFMKAGQSLKGGKELIYQSFGVYSQKICADTAKVHDKFRDVKSPVRNYGDDVSGSIILTEIFKNKNGPEGREVRMFFDPKKGYQRDLCDFENIFAAKYGIQGSGFYTLDILPEIRFTTRSLKEDCMNNPLLARAIQFTAKFKTCCEVFDNITPPSLEPLRKLDYDLRVYLILTYTKDYADYVRSGHFVKDDDMQMYQEIMARLGNKYYEDRFMCYHDLYPYLEHPEEFNDTIMFDTGTTILTGEVRKYGKDEYVF